MINVELAKRVLDYIEAHPDEHDQDSFIDKSRTNVCGTTLCIAWHAMIESGEFEVRFIHRWPAIVGINREFEPELDYELEGARVLGLTDQHEIDTLFYNLGNEVAIDYLRQLIAEAERAAKA